MSKNALEKRMKEDYENRSKTYLVRRMPVIIRLDGKAFHTFTRELKKPYDAIFHIAMNQTLKYLCENIQGCKIGYTQSDEITLLLTDYDNIDTSAWFDYSLHKMCSISASMATLEFNRVFEREARMYIEGNPNDEKYCKSLMKAIEKGAMFDSRGFNVPEHEVANCFIWRQQDGIRNAVQMLGQVHFSHNKLNRKSTEDIKKMLMEQDVDFEAMPVEFKRGVCCIKKKFAIDKSKRIVSVYDETEKYDMENTVIREKWVLDMGIPVFSENRSYIEDIFMRG